MGVATRVERKLGPSAAGWLAALPVGFAVAVVAVLLDTGGRATSAMALSAAAPVVAQAVSAIVAAAPVVRRGRTASAVAGVLAYLLVTAGVAAVPEPVAVALAVPALIVAARLTPAPPPRAAESRHWSVTLMTCVACAVVVGGAVLSAQLAGPVIAGAVAAFPTTSTVLAMASSIRAGAPAAVSVLVGLVRSLPCYLTFCLVVALLAPAVALFAVPVALLACGGVGLLTWRTVPLVSRSTAPTPLPTAV